MTLSDFYSFLKTHYNSELPFVAYRKPDSVMINALLQNNSILYTTSSFNESGFVFAPFDSSKQVVLIPYESSKHIITIYSDSEIKKKIKKQDEVLFTTKEEHLHLIENGIQSIKNGQLVKVVLSRKEEVALPTTNILEIFNNLLDNYLNALVYCWYHPKVGLWLGATPETLLQVEANRFKTMALAGTQSYKGTLDVQWNLKEKEEHDIVTNSIYRALKKNVNSITVSKTNTVKAGNLLHLQTQISGTLYSKLQEVNLELLLKSLHPTPAICGFPKETAKQFILENENYNREYYTGFLGEINFSEITKRNSNKRNVENNAYTIMKKVSNIFVNLRCMQIKDQKALIYVGGGITKDSIAEHEWEETVNKTSTIKNCL